MSAKQGGKEKIFSDEKNSKRQKVCTTKARKIPTTSETQPNRKAHLNVGKAGEQGGQGEGGGPGRQRDVAIATHSERNVARVAGHCRGKNCKKKRMRRISE